ncbi:MAG: DegT/DnrJ/EryC1/StrS family aminotransferase [Spirochaetes bacterium]|nr:MAG: DegT/DnrJ/EryC1/StrS family aminotransferase [Spirochaetota bacterium]
MKPIPFSPPDITQAEIDAVAEVMRSGWITTGPRVMEFEKKIAEYCGTPGAVCLSSATAGLELVLRLLDIGPGDEVITTPCTYAATANVILHVGARPVFVDVGRGSFLIDPDAVAAAVTKRTKAVIPVDFGGWPADYRSIALALDSRRKKYRPRKNSLQCLFDRPAVIADAAHSIGARCGGGMSGSLADFSVFSFHAVKNLTTAEGGAVTFGGGIGPHVPEMSRQLKLFSLHGQSKDALAKQRAGGWRYSIELPGYKCNMTDIQAAMGLAQLERYEREILPARREIFTLYRSLLGEDTRLSLPLANKGEIESSCHLYPVIVKGADEQRRDAVIERMAAQGIACNVHFIPVVMHPAYTRLGYRMDDYPRCYEMFRAEISLPVYSRLLREDARRVAETLRGCL